ncbi:MAG: hypothetical protein KC550_00950, partial [Nanoarchaeota archaeon]|nr:hypothetical protein [Nanoarchaeota archaeon]
MLKKIKIFLFLLFIIFEIIFVGYAIDYTNCNNILGAGTNNTISTNIVSNYSGTYCFTMANGASLDCQGYSIDGNGTINYIFYPNAADNVTIKNCGGSRAINLVYGNGAEGLELYNITGDNLSSRGIYLNGANGAVMDNVTIEKANTDGILITSGENIS